MLAGGWKLSASRNGQPSAFANAAPVVLLPQPATPMSTMTSGAVLGMILQSTNSTHGGHVSLQLLPSRRNRDRRCAGVSRRRHWMPAATPQVRACTNELDEAHSLGMAGGAP